MQRVGGELGRVALGRRQAAERRVDLVDADPRRVEHRLAVDHLGDRRGRRPRRAAALGVEADRGDPAVLERSEIRDRSPQAAPPAAPVKAPSGAGPRRRLVAR